MVFHHSILYILHQLRLLQQYPLGFANVSGRLEKPQIEGRLTLNNGGLAIPYLNVDYEFVNNSTIKLREQSFIFEQALMVDTDYQSQVLLDGSISHNNFSNWSLKKNCYIYISWKQNPVYMKELII